MDEQKVNDRIKNFILQQGINIDIISKSKLKQLEKIDIAIQRRTEILDKAKKDIKENKINISSIADETGISRKTFYNNELLKTYVEYYITNEEYDNNLKKENDNLKEEFDKLVDKYNKEVEQINLLIMKDINFENLKYENEEILKENNMLKERSIILEEELEKTKRELFEIRKSISKVVPFNKKD